MAERLADQVQRKISEARALYHRLILIVGPAGSGKTSALKEVSSSTSLSAGNLPAAPDAAQAGLVLFDNIEILFDVHLKQDPLRLLQGLSRNKTVVAAWNGSIVNGHLIYATPDHPEYRRYPMRDFLVVNLEGSRYR